MVTRQSLGDDGRDTVGAGAIRDFFGASTGSRRIRACL